VNKEEFIRIQKKLKYTDTKTAEALGLRIDTVHGYKRGEKIPLIVNNFLRFLQSCKITTGHVDAGLEKLKQWGL